MDEGEGNVGRLPVLELVSAPPATMENTHLWMMMKKSMGKLSVVQMV
jgi:hypothetical protein